MKPANNYDVIQAFEAWILNEGNTKLSEPIEETAPNEIKRVHVKGDSQGTKNAAYTFHINGKPSGYFENFKTGFKGNWTYQGEYQGEPISAAEIEKRKEEAEKQQAKKYKDAAKQAQGITKNALQLLPSDYHAYVKTKRIKEPHGLLYDYVTRKISGGYQELKRLIIPLSDSNGLSTLQFIYEDGTKQLLKGGKKSGSFYKLNPIETPLYIAIAEGFATIASIAEDSYVKQQGFMCVMGIDADNLPKVAKTMREQYPEAEIIIFGDIGDTDHKGEKRAKEAAKLVDGYAVFPPMAKGDFNDYLTGHNITLSLKQLINEATRQLPNTNRTTAKNSPVKNLTEKEKIFSETQKKATQTTLSSNNAVYSDLKRHQNDTKSSKRH